MIPDLAFAILTTVVSSTLGWTFAYLQFRYRHRRIRREEWRAAALFYQTKFNDEGRRRI
jgi:hypothetical protein